MPDPISSPALLKLPNSTASSGSGGVNPGSKSAASSAAESGAEAGASNSGIFANELKNQMARAKQSDGADSPQPAAEPAGAQPAVEVAASADALALPEFFSQLMPQLAQQQSQKDAKTTADDLVTDSTDPSAGAAVALVTPQLRTDNPAAKNAKAATPAAVAPETGTAEAHPDPVEDDAQTAKLAATAAKSAETGRIEVPPASANQGKGDFAEALTHAAEQQARGVQQVQGQAQQAAAAAQATSHPGAEVRISTPAGHEAWSTEVGNTLTWMATAQRQTADLVLNPPQLGRIEVSLTVSGDQANAVFASPNAAVREMLEDSLPRLREILAGAGINLGEAQVGSESPGRSDLAAKDGERAPQPPSALASVSTLSLASTGGSAPRTGRGMVDVFA